VEDAEALLEAGWLVPCGSSRSPVLQRIRDGSMPPPDSGMGQPTLVEIDTLAAFIDRPCAGPRGYLVP
jgi:hypothetical protein